MKKIIWLTVAFVIVLSVLFIFINNYFSELTPLGYAKRQSGLKLPKGIKLVKFNQHWESENGDGSRYIEFNLTQQEAEDLQRQCMKESYSNLPVRENGYNPFTSKKDDKDYYKIKFTSSNNRSHELAILDMTRKKFYIIVEIV